MIGENTLISRDSKGKIRVVQMSYQWEDEHEGFVIRRFTSQYQGKVTSQPIIIITKGKVKRTVSEQAKLEYNSHLKKYQDKGYKLLNKSLDSYTKEELEVILPTNTTDSNGNLKPMLAKDFNKVSASSLERKWLASRKLDGVRMTMFLKNGEVCTASRGGKNYDASTYHITHHEDVINLFKVKPELILDGELYIHGRPLQYLSGLARLEKDDFDRCQDLEFHVYDILDPNKAFKDRLEDIGLIETEFLGNSEAKIVFVQHEEVNGWAQIKAIHDKYVAEGYEGCVIRNPDKVYGVDKRTNDMIKVKMYQDAEFEIIGWSEGLRPEDMVFKCITKDGNEFEAKPMGPRELKWEYLERMDEIIGKMATVKFFMYSEEGTPLQPVLKTIRDYE